ncbi:MAG: NYN domain-containing protein [bacterium]
MNLQHPMQHPEQRVGIFIDVQNMYYSGRNLFDAKVNFGNIVKRAVADRKLIRAIAYVVRTKTREEQPFIDALQKSGIETKEKELMEYFGGQKKADWDVGIAVDAIRMSDILDVIVIVSGDGDYCPLLDYLKGHGRQVEIMAFRETTSSRLVESADIYTNLSDDQDEFLILNRTAQSGRAPRKNGKREPLPHAEGEASNDETETPTALPGSYGLGEKWAL